MRSRPRPGRTPDPVPKPLLPLAVAMTAALALQCGPPSPDSTGPERAVGDGRGPAETPPPAPDGPFLLALGTAQDGGLPHAACACVRCRAAREDPARARRIASLGLVVPGHGVYLIDATPDVREQLDALRPYRDAPADRVDRTPVDGVFLTHAHWGHYTGLGFFGFESVHTRGLPVWVTASMAEFLAGNAPWSQLVDFGNVELRTIDPGSDRVLLGAVQVEALAVPHRDEFADTVGFAFRTDARAVLYVPDTDGWRHWKTPVEELLRGYDVAILDATFFSGDELPGREVSEIGHPLIVETMDRLQPLVDAGSLTVYLTHLNHSNPALDPDGPERARIERRGFRVLADGDTIDL